MQLPSGESCASWIQLVCWTFRKFGPEMSESLVPSVSDSDDEDEPLEDAARLELDVLSSSISSSSN